LRARRGRSGLDASRNIDIIPTMATRTRPATGQLARVFHALSDETRLSILQRLRLGERCVCDLTDALDAAQSRLSFHLKVLKEAGLVTDRREGRWMYYTLNPESLKDVAEQLEVLGSSPTAAERKAGCC
jgi:ArsR family transcriptional regulator